MKRSNCCKRSTVWRKRRHGIGSRSEKPAPAGSFRRAQSWRRCCRRFRLLSCLSWRCIFHESWENNSKFQMGGLRETGGLLLFSPVRAHLLTTAPKGQQWYLLLASRALSEGDCGCCGSLQTMPQHLWALLSSSARLGKYRRFNRRYFSNRLRKPATGSFAAEMDG